MVIALVVVGILATIAVASYAPARETAAVVAMERDLETFATLQTKEFKLASQYRTLAELGGALQLSDGVAVDQVTHSQDRVYLRVRHTGTDAKCRVDLSERSDLADNRIRCWGGPTNATTEPPVIAEPPVVAIVDTTKIVVPPVVVPDVVLAPLISAPSDLQLDPGQAFAQAFTLTNPSAVARSYSFNISSSDPSVVSAPATPTPVTVGAGASRVVTVASSMSGSASGGAASRLMLVATDQADPGLSGAGGFNAVANSVVRAPSVTTPPDQNANPGQTVVVAWTFTNRSNVDRDYNLVASSSDPGLALAGVSGGGRQIIAAGQMHTVQATYVLVTGAVAGSARDARIQATDVVAPAYGASDEVRVTTNLVLAAPLVAGPANRTEDNGASFSGTFQVTNRSNAARTFQITPAVTGDLVITSATNTGRVTIPAYAMINVGVNYQLAASSQGGATSQASLAVVDEGAPSLASSTSFTVTTRLNLAAPTVTAPADVSADPSATGTLSFTVQNNTNASRTFTFAATSSNTAVVPDPADPAAITIPAGGSQTVTVSYSVAAGATGGSSADVTLRATDRDATTYTGAGPATVTTNTVLAAPTVAAPAAASANPGTAQTATYRVTNRSNVSRTFRFVASSSNTAVVSDPADPANVTIPAGQTVDVAVTYTVATGATGGSSSTISLEAIDTGSAALTGSAGFTFTTNTVLVAPSVTTPANRSEAPGATYTVSWSITNGSNVARTITVSHAASGDHTVTSASGLGSSSFGPGETKVVSVTYRLAAGSLAGTESRGTVSASDASAGSGAGTFTTTTALVLANPGATAPPSRTDVIGTAFTQSWTVTNNTNATRTLSLTPTLGSGSALQITGSSGTGSQSYGAGETKTVSVSYLVQSGSQPTSTHTASLVIQDAAAPSYSTTSSWTFTVANRNPVVDFSWTPIVQAGQAWSFTSTASDPDAPGDGISRVVWSWGDGSADQTGATVSKTFTTGGTYLVRATAYDNYGGSQSVVKSVAVNTPPRACISMTPTNPMPNQDVTFSSCSTDADGDALSHAWAFSDGMKASGSSVTRRFAGGDYSVDLAVDDGRGGSTSAWSRTSMSFSVGEPLSVWVDCPASAHVTESFTCTLSAAGGTWPYTYSWGSSTSSFSGSAEGWMTVSGTVTDAAGEKASASANVLIDNSAPIASISCPLEVDVGTAYSCSASGSDPDAHDDSMATMTTSWGAWTNTYTAGATEGTERRCVIVYDRHGKASAEACADVVVKENKCQDKSAINFGEKGACVYVVKETRKISIDYLRCQYYHLSGEYQDYEKWSASVTKSTYSDGRPVEYEVTDKKQNGGYTKKIGKNTDPPQETRTQNCTGRGDPPSDSYFYF